jgi:glutamine synthetase
MAEDPEPRPKPDDWTRFSPPPKTRISNRFADPAARFRLVQAGMLALALAGLGYAIVRYAATRTESVRRQEIERQQDEPSPSERRAKSAEDFLRKRNVETAPFQRSQDERAKRWKSE